MAPQGDKGKGKEAEQSKPLVSPHPAPILTRKPSGSDVLRTLDPRDSFSLLILAHCLRSGFGCFRRIEHEARAIFILNKDKSCVCCSALPSVDLTVSLQP